MRQGSDYQAALNETVLHIAHASPRVEALLARHFPAGGGSLYPDAHGNVCLAEGGQSAADRPASVYARSVARLGTLVAAFSAAAMDQATLACIMLAKERTVFACALDLARHPLDTRQRQLFVARMMPSPAPLHRHDDATASCIWLRLWTIHAWVLELRLAMTLYGDVARADQDMLNRLDRDLTDLLRPEAPWLSVDLGMAAPAEMVARAPSEALAVGNLLWPNRLGAMLSEGDLCPRTLQRHGIGLRREDGRTWLSIGKRFAEAPHQQARLGAPFQPRKNGRTGQRLGRTSW